MLNAVEVGSQVKIDDPRLPLHNRSVNPENRFSGCSFRTVAVRSRLEIGFPSRGVPGVL